MPTVRVLRPFANRHSEDIVHPGDEITVDADRARDLQGNGLVEPAAGEKAAPIPQNKAAPLPANKGRPRGAPRQADR